MVRSVAALVGFACLASCGTDGSTTVVQRLPFGPFTVPPGQDITDQCVQVTLHNDADIYVSRVELETGGGFHHSNWDFVPAEDEASGALGAFPGPDGEFTCADRNFDEAVGAQKGGTLFAQSTQSSSDVQQFPDGAALKIPKHSKLISSIHLLNSGDDPLTLTPTISLTLIPKNTVTTLMSAMAFENHALGLPPGKPSRFSVDCDFTSAWKTLYDAGNVASPVPDFHVYYALAHYHKYGTGMTLDAIRPDDTAHTLYDVHDQVGESLGETLDPSFDMTGFSRMRFACDYTNTTQQTIRWGFGTQEMCVFLAFTDSQYLWGGGALTNNPPGPATVVDGVSTYSHACQVFALESSTH